MIIAGNFSRVGKKTASTNDGIRLQLGRDVDPSFDFDKVSKSAVWRKHVEVHLPKKYSPPAPGTSSFKALPRKENKLQSDDLSYKLRYNVTHPRSHSAHISGLDARRDAKNKPIDRIYDVPDPHKVPVPLIGQYLPRAPLLDTRGNLSEVGEPLASSLSKRGSPDFGKLLNRKKIELDTYFEPGKYSLEGVRSEKGLPPWTVKQEAKVEKKMPLLNQVSPPPNF